MDRMQARNSAEAETSARHFREEVDENAARSDAMLSAERALEVSGDEDAGSDPYNHTGRFKRNIR
jgi:hypothetical protein